MDLLCRVITSVFFLGGGKESFRKDNELIVYFQSYGKKIIIKGNEIKGLNPDERSQAGMLKKVFSGKNINGVNFKPGKWTEIVNLFPNCNVLDLSGQKIEKKLFINNIFLLGDHIGLANEEIGLFSEERKVSVGNRVYLTSQCISIINYLLDKKV
ncbi:MAG: tRNA (pseudouridine(54)-N(1))-methyltransferase [Candidatus Heimdallarchaeota archaeon LC_3]|nr:MAG: tRNA (pseudouridine(54)-N(1))-methyltransferase [Candidatus Heimdallarchaeota archaeon LC_3]